jgi:exodeoxyribonuclease VIII
MNTVTPGLYDDLPNHEYHGGLGTSKSGLDILHRSPMHFAFRASAANDNAPTAAQSLGSAFHASVLEPDLFAEMYVVAPQCDRRTKEGKALWEEFQASNVGKEHLTADAMIQIHGMRDALLAHPAAAKLLSAPGKAERSYYWIDEETGELLRCRPDFDRDDGIIVDLKSTHDASPEEFARSIGNWRYHVQHPFYMDGRDEAIRQAGLDLPKSKAFVFIAVEKTPPYAVGVYMLDAAGVEAGRMEYRADLRMLAECRRTNVWRGYGDNIQSISLPAWRLLRASA